MFCGSKLCQWGYYICRRPGLLVVLVLSALLMMPYFISEYSNKLNRYQYVPGKFDDHESGEYRKEFLVWNPKCEILDRNPLDPSIMEFIKKKEFEACTTTDLLTKIIRTSKGELILKVDQKLAKSYVGLSCCWAPIDRPKPTKVPDRGIDFQISMGPCTDFREEVILPRSTEVVFVKCNDKKIKLRSKTEENTVYKNVHPVLQLEKVREKLDQKKTWNGTRKLSVLVLGIDNVSRMNFERSMPKTGSHLKETGWTELKGYNKMGENTFPNLMAMLTGLNQSRSYDTCTPRKSFGLDNCPMLWYGFRNASYVTAYGEDTTDLGTFNYMKVGFVNPPTDYYLRPYMIAAEKYLTSKTYLEMQYYCTGPEPSGSRIINYAWDFAKNFIGVPYFGFFWINSMSHDDINGPSSIDDYTLSMFQRLDHEGILNDTMFIFLSDHGMRWGRMRETVQGWFEERLPFIYIHLPEWFKEENREFAEALKSNGERLTSPFDIYETLRDILIRGGGNADQSEGCPQCQSLFNPVPTERGCDDVGVGHHWCSCTTFGNGSISDKIALEAAHKIVTHIDNIAKQYKDSKGKRLCVSLSLKRIIRVNEMVDPQAANYSTTDSNYKQFLCQLEVAPGDGKFEAVIRYYEDGNITIVDDDVSRINTYSITAKCLNVGAKQYCFCP